MEAIQQSEGLWRDVYRPKEKKALDRPVQERRYNSITRGVFSSTQGPDAKVSTNLYDRVSREYATSQGDLRSGRIQGSKGVQGWLVIQVSDAVGGRRQIVHSPLDDNPYHAEILLPDEHTRSWEDAEVHLRWFLTVSRWEDRAGPLPETCTGPDAH